MKGFAKDGQTHCCDCGRAFMPDQDEWDPAGVVATSSAELSSPRDQLCHEIRNALAGIQYERKQIAKSLITIQTHMARIEAALR